MLPPPSDSYRPDIDGLRGLAVTLVVLFHAFPDAMPGGFIGVDIFFVISGFLITGIIARKLSAGRFSLSAFYSRRIRRIFPALIIVLCAVLTLGWLWMLPAAYAQLSSDVVASTAFLANIALLLQSGYFDTESAKKPLLHLWSLGIEEQFYLFWPLLLMMAARARLSLFGVTLAIGLVSFGLNIALIDPYPVATFYLPFTRAFELAAGASLACCWGRIDHSGATSNGRALSGIVLIVAAAAILNVHRAFPGWWALLPVTGSALLLSAPNAWGCRHMLSSRPMVWVGLISYPLYLWHWPLLVFFAIIKFAPLTLLERGLIVALSIALAWITYRFLETPLRFGAANPRKVAGLSAAMVLVAAGAAVVVAGGGFDSRLPDEIRGMAHVPTQSAKWRIHRCLLDLSQENTFAAECANPGRRPLLVVWGDSTAGALMPGLRKAQETHTFEIAQFTSSSCIPALDADIAGTPNCRAMNDKVLALVREIKPEIVLLHGTWEKHIENVAKTVTALKEIGARVVVLGPVPGWKRGLPNEVLRYFMLHHTLIPQRFNGGVTTNWYDAVMRKELVPRGAEFISAWDALCNSDGCLTRTGDEASDISASDQVHLTEKGSIFLVQTIIDAVLGERATERSSNDNLTTQADRLERQGSSP